MKKNNYSSIIIFNQSIFSKSMEDLLSKIEKKLDSSRKLAHIFTPNPEQLVLASQNKKFEKNLKKADILIPDGIGLLWASWFLDLFKKTGVIKERITGSDLVKKLLNIAKQKKYKVLLLGGKNYHKTLAKDYKFSQVSGYPGLYKFAPGFYWTPAYQKVQQPKESEEVLVKKTIQRLKPKIVLAAFGAPDQEEWLMSHDAFLEKNQTRLTMSVGGSFDFIFGKVQRSPVIIQKLGFEWLFRLFKQPWRWKRQLRLIKFVLLVVKEALI